MKKILAVVSGVVALIVVGILVLAATKPDTFRIERSLTMRAAPERVISEVDDFHNWPHWSPYEKLDPSMQRTYSGAASGKGAVYTWAGTKEAGSGRMEITDVSPARQVSIHLDFTAPFAASNVATFSFEPTGDATKVTWAMTGPSPFVSKIMQVFVSMDKLVGKDFEAGLASMKAVVEAAPQGSDKKPLFRSASDAEAETPQASSTSTRPAALLLRCRARRSLATARSAHGNDSRTEYTLSFTPPPGAG
jgi:hypothetical protein